MTVIFSFNEYGTCGTLMNERVKDAFGRYGK